MQRHRAARLAVLLSLKTIDAKPDGVERTTCCIKPASGPLAAARIQDARRPSTIDLMEPSSSNSSLAGGSENCEPSHQNVRGKSPRADESCSRPITQADSGLEMNVDITQAANDSEGDSYIPETQDETRDGRCNGVNDTMERGKDEERLGERMHFDVCLLLCLWLFAAHACGLCVGVWL